MTRFINRCLELLCAIFGAYRDASGRITEHRVWAYINPRTEKGERLDGFAILRWGRNRGRIRWEWALGTLRFGAGLTVGDAGDEQIGISLSVPLVSFWWGINALPSRWFKDFSKRHHYNDMETSLRVFDWAIWWKVWTPENEWSNKTPKWREGSWHVLDTLLGKHRHTSRELLTREVVIPMPEGAYAATVKLTEESWRRPRWFAKTLRRAHIDLPKGIPHAGKGENSWDCGDDALWGMTTCASTVEEAIAKTVESVLRSRRKYDGNVMAEYPLTFIEQETAAAA